MPCAYLFASIDLFYQDHQHEEPDDNQVQARYHLPSSINLFDLDHQHEERDRDQVQAPYHLTSRHLLVFLALGKEPLPHRVIQPRATQRGFC